MFCLLLKVKVDDISVIYVTTHGMVLKNRTFALLYHDLL